MNLFGIIKYVSFHSSHGISDLWMQMVNESNTKLMREYVQETSHVES